MSLDKLPINLFDLALVGLLVAGIYRGRKHGMSEELMLLLKWLVIVFGCILLTALALLNARFYTPMEVRAMEKFQDDVYGSNYFPTLHSFQAEVFERSIAGAWIKKNLDFLLIKPTEPDRTQFKQKELK